MENHWPEWDDIYDKGIDWMGENGMGWFIRFARCGILAALIVLSMTGCSDFEYITDGEICAVRGYHGKGKEIIIPETIKGKRVLFIGGGPLRNHVYPRELDFDYRPPGTWGDVEKITIPDTVVCLGDDAFASCLNLKEISIPNSVTSVHHRILADCPELREVALPEGLTYLTGGTFSGCSNLVEVSFPESLRGVGPGAFSECASLERIVFPEGLLKVGNSVFGGCTSLREAVLPDTVESVGAYAFQGCGGLTNAVLSIGLKWLGDDAFGMCENLERVEIRSGVRIGDRAFQYCTSLSEIVMDGGPAHIEDRAFLGCKGSSVLDLPDELESIGDLAFCGWIDLTTVNLPSKLKTLGDAPFADCMNLQEFSISVSNLNFSVRAGWLYDKSGTKLILCPQKQAAAIRVPAGVTNIADGAFSGFYITHIDISQSVTQMDGAFDFCSNLQEITVDEANTRFSSIDGILYNGRGTRLIRCPPGKAGRVFIPEGVVAIAPNAFQYCRKIAAIVLPETVSEIGEDAFSSCYQLKQITLSPNIRTIPDDTFNCCRSLTSIYIPGSIFAIDDDAFYDCVSLGEIVVDESNPAYSSHDGMLYDKKKEKLILCPEGKSGSVKVLDSVRSMERGAFAGCHGVTGVELPDAISRIDKYTFVRCTNLTEIVIPARVEVIGDSAFYECPNLLSVYFEGDAPEFKGWTVFRCSSGAESNAVLYYQPGTKGWNAEMVDRPTKVWNSGK